MDVFDRLYPPIVDAPEKCGCSTERNRDGVMSTRCDLHRVPWPKVDAPEDDWRSDHTAVGRAIAARRTHSPAFAAAVALLDKLVALSDKKWLSPPMTKQVDGLCYSQREWQDGEVSLDYAIGEVRRIANAARAEVFRVHQEEVERGK